MSLKNIYREAMVDRMLDDGTFEECKEEGFREIMRDKDRKDWLNDTMLTKLAEDYDLTVAVTQFTDEQKLAVFECLLGHIKDVLHDETDDLAHNAISTMAEDME